MDKFFWCEDNIIDYATYELKTTEFHPSYQGQLEFYLEALDQEERRSNENPTIGIILCKESDMETVRFALNRSMSPMMIMQYKEQLKVGGVIQRSIEEYCKYITSIWYNPRNKIALHKS